MSKNVAIVGIGYTSFRPLTPDVSYKELMYEAAVKAYEDAGIDPRRDVDSFVTVAEDFHEGTSIFDEYVPDQLGGVLKPVQTITGDGLHGLATAYMLIRTGMFDIVALEVEVPHEGTVDHGSGRNRQVAHVDLEPLGHLTPAQILDLP